MLKSSQKSLWREHCLLPFLFSYLLHSFTNKNWVPECARHWGICEHGAWSWVAGLKSSGREVSRTPQVPQKEELGTVPSAMPRGTRARLHLPQYARLNLLPWKVRSDSKKAERKREEKGPPRWIPRLEASQAGPGGNWWFWTEMELQFMYWIGHFDWERDCSYN